MRLDPRRPGAITKNTERRSRNQSRSVFENLCWLVTLTRRRICVNNKILRVSVTKNESCS
jgi:hypothetical protein